MDREPRDGENTIFSFSLEPHSITPQLNCDGFPALLSNGNNLSTDNSCNLNLASDRPATNALLGPIANNDGPTQTNLPLVGSPAIDTGSNTGCPATGVTLAAGVIALAGLRRGLRRVQFAGWEAKTRTPSFPKDMTL